MGWALPTPWLFSGFHLGHGEEIRAYRCPPFYMPLSAALLTLKWLQAAAQKLPNKGAECIQTSVSAFTGLKLAYFSQFCNENISQPEINLIKSKIETHGSCNPWAKAKSLILSTWLCYFLGNVWLFWHWSRIRHSLGVNGTKPQNNHFLLIIICSVQQNFYIFNNLYGLSS